MIFLSVTLSRSPAYSECACNHRARSYQRNGFVPLRSANSDIILLTVTVYENSRRESVRLLPLVDTAGQSSCKWSTYRHTLPQQTRNIQTEISSIRFLGYYTARAGFCPWDNRGKANSWPPPYIKICKKMQALQNCDSNEFIELTVGTSRVLMSKAATNNICSNKHKA
jgi:hypothetical protein